MARPTSRHSRFSSLWVSRSIFSSLVDEGVSSIHTALMSLAPEYFDAYGVTVGVDVGLGGRHPRSLHLRMRQHLREDVVAQRFLQVDMALAQAGGDGAADEVVVDHLVEFVRLRRRDVERHVEVDIDDHA